MKNNKNSNTGHTTNTTYRNTSASAYFDKKGNYKGTKLYTSSSNVSSVTVYNKSSSDGIGFSGVMRIVFVIIFFVTFVHIVLGGDEAFTFSKLMAVFRDSPDFDWGFVLHIYSDWELDTGVLDWDWLEFLVNDLLHPVVNAVNFLAVGTVNIITYLFYFLKVLLTV